jgi:hypothetical protein
MAADETLVPGSTAGRDGVERSGDEIGPYRLVSPLGRPCFVMRSVRGAEDPQVVKVKGRIAEIDAAGQ